MRAGIAWERLVLTTGGDLCQTPRPLPPPAPRPASGHPSLSSVSWLIHLAPLLHFPAPSTLGVVVRFGSNLEKPRRGRRRGVSGGGRTPCHPRLAVGAAAGVTAVHARLPSAVTPPSATLRCAPPADPSSEAGLAEGGGRQFCRCGKWGREKPGVQRRLRWAGAQLYLAQIPWPSTPLPPLPPLPLSPPPPHRRMLGDVRRAAAGAAVTECTCVRARARQQARTPMPLPPRSRTPPGSASSLFFRPHIPHPRCVRACVRPGHRCRPLPLPPPPAPQPPSAPCRHPSPQGHYGDVRERFVFNSCHYSEGRNTGTEGNLNAVYFKPLLL